MLSSTTLARMVTLGCVWTVLTASQTRDVTSEHCATVEQALRLYYSFKPGTLRAEIEEKFALEGGLQFPTPSRYRFKDCRFIKLEVEYELATPRGGSMQSPNDVAKSLSKLSIDYPTTD